MKHLGAKIFVVSMLLQELLDETDGSTRFKNNLRFHLRETSKALDAILDEPIGSDELSLLLGRAVEALEDVIDSVEEETE